MPRSWKRQTDRGVPLSILERASNDVRNQGKSTRSVAKLYGICHVTLHRFCKERKKVEEQGSMELPRVGYHSGKKVFTDEQEKELTEYLMRVKELAYQLAVKHGCKHPKSWDKFSRAGPDWFSAYMKRNPTLSIRSAEATSLARATSFNQHNVAMFFKKFDEVLKRHTLTANDILMRLA
uniref:HTH psq-type domain-containing protein n=1 Tax=Maylandia zebra TaxID=106582 RepID=A0A3P9CHQ9_9CICH